MISKNTLNPKYGSIEKCLTALQTETNTYIQMNIWHCYQVHAKELKKYIYECNKLLEEQRTKNKRNK